jgi:dipeptidyl aminopeptidase/acylaminoacyl peptidase
VSTHHRAAAACGTWTSPITAETVAVAGLRFAGITIHGDDVYWVEGRPEEAGRNVVVKRTPDGPITDVSPPSTNVRTRVHEYGGGAHAIAAGNLYFVEFTDQRVYKCAVGTSDVVALTPPGPWSYADFAVDTARGRIVCVREDHTDPAEVTTTLVALPLEGGSAGEPIVAGHDFYAAPRLNADGTRLSWLAWRHPQMPWDGTELWVADVERDGRLRAPRLIAGGKDESIYQPEWSLDGQLFFVSDRSGWWNLYRADEHRITAICPMDADFGRPMWALGTATWAFAGTARLVVAYARQGQWRLATIELTTGTLEPLTTPVEPADTLAATSARAIVLGGSARTPDSIVQVDLRTGETETLRSSLNTAVDPAYFSTPQLVTFPGEAGSAHAFFYPPANPHAGPLADERPPLIVNCHGGPTGSAHTRLNLEIQYWTSRGFAVADVNYGGSTAHGREYRRRLRGAWGVVDVSDCVNAARWLAAQHAVDPDRLLIRGRSAGGYTTLAALTFHSGMFRAGASYYGIADLERLAQDTHKFESRYLDGLIGPYPAARDTYRSRSPIHHLDQLMSPLILFQGLEDRIVPPNQAHMMADAVRAKGIPIVLVMFPGEQHGFRRADSIVRCLEAELSFYADVLGITSRSRSAPP